MGPNGQVNSYDAARPISWHRELPNGSRVFYTALGHATDNYTSDALFRMHIKDGLVWLLDTETGILDEHSTSIWVAPIPAPDAINIINAKPGSHLTLLDPSGRVVRSGRTQDALTTINVRDLPTGLYSLRVGARAKPVMVLH